MIKQHVSVESGIQHAGVLSFIGRLKIFKSNGNRLTYGKMRLFYHYPQWFCKCCCHWQCYIIEVDRRLEKQALIRDRPRRGFLPISGGSILLPRTTFWLSIVPEAGDFAVI